MPTPPNDAVSGVRAEGLLSSGLPYRADDVYPCGWTREAGYRRMRAILEERRDFDGVCCLNDPIAIGAHKALTDAGIRVPQDVAVIGFDGVEDGRYLAPGLTSVTIDVHEAADTCLKLLTRSYRAGNRTSPGTTDNRSWVPGSKLVAVANADNRNENLSPRARIRLRKRCCQAYRTSSLRPQQPHRRPLIRIRHRPALHRTRPQVPLHAVAQD